jgi:hypothetical protein
MRSFFSVKEKRNCCEAPSHLDIDVGCNSECRESMMFACGVGVKMK